MFDGLPAEKSLEDVNGLVQVLSRSSEEDEVDFRRRKRNNRILVKCRSAGSTPASDRAVIQPPKLLWQGEAWMENRGTDFPDLTRGVPVLPTQQKTIYLI